MSLSVLILITTAAADTAATAADDGD